MTLASHRRRTLLRAEQLREHVGRAQEFLRRWRWSRGPWVTWDWLQAAVIYTTINNGTSLASIDTDTGDVTIIGPFGFGGTFGNAFDLDGTMYATLNFALSLVNNVA